MAFPRLRTSIAPLVFTVLSSHSALAMAPLARPEVNTEVPAGQAAPFAGSWAVTMPTREVSDPSITLAICTLPVRIEAANDTHIFYLGPSETEPEAAIELLVENDGTSWQPTAGGSAFFALWVTPDQFYLYDAVVNGEPDWDSPYIYERCS